MRDAGFDVLEATTGEEAIRIAQEQPRDLAILDMHMPGMSGIEAARTIQEIGVPVVYLSAYDDTETVEAAVAAGALGYLVKPVDVPRIVPMVEAALRRSAELRELAGEKTSLVAALDASKEINVAVGIVMEHFRLTRDEAFEALRRRARSERRRVQAVAEEVLAAAETFNTTINALRRTRDDVSANVPPAPTRRKADR